MKGFRWVAVSHKNGTLMERYPASGYTPQSALDEFCRSTGYDRADFRAEYTGRMLTRRK